MELLCLGTYQFKPGLWNHYVDVILEKHTFISLELQEYGENMPCTFETIRHIGFAIPLKS